MKNIFNITTLLLLLSTTIFADVSGVGYGESIKIAKAEALSDMSQSIKSEVRTLYTAKSDDHSSKAEFHSQISSNLPLLGVSFSIKDSKDHKMAVAYLRTEKVFPLYVAKIDDILQEMKEILKEIKISKSKSLQLAGYENLYALEKEFSRYKSVAKLLKPHYTPQVVISQAKIESRILKLSADVDSLEMAASIIASSFKKSNIYVYPPHIVNNTTIAPFGSIISKLLVGKLHTVSTLYTAKYIAVGEYVVSKQSLLLNMQLLDIETKEVVKSKTVLINEKAYRGISLKPQGVDFDTLLKNGIAESSDLKVRLNSNRGSENLLFREDDEVEVFVKLNKMGYLYIVGYTQTLDTKLSYLLELSEGEGSSRFIKFVNADDASRWISLGSFTVEPPYGIESLQVIASNKKIRKLPDTEYDIKTGYYVISKELKKALEHTRGLRPKRSEKVESSEDVMSFTTMKE